MVELQTSSAPAGIRRDPHPAVFRNYRENTPLWPNVLAEVRQNALAPAGNPGAAMLILQPEGKVGGANLEIKGCATVAPKNVSIVRVLLPGCTVQILFLKEQGTRGDMIRLLDDRNEDNVRSCTLETVPS